MRYSILWCALAATLSAASGCTGNALGGSSVDAGTYGWASLSSDASLAFTNKADPAANAPQSRRYNFPPTSTTAINVNGIPTERRRRSSASVIG